MKKRLFILLIFLGITRFVSAQNYTINTGGTVTTCSGNFYDSGGSSGNYSNNENSSMVICPQSSDEVVKVHFTAFNTQQDYDVLIISDGAGDTFDILSGTPGVPFDFVSNVAGQCVTFNFVSNGSTVKAGWAGAISCATPCVTPTAAFTDVNDIELCSSSALNPSPLTLSFDASASSVDSGSSSIVKYYWSWGDGTSDSSTTPIRTHTFPSAPGLYSVKLRVRTDNTTIDPLGCQSLNEAIKVVKILPPPIFTGSTANTITATCNNSIALKGVATSQTVTQPLPTVPTTPVFLPDGSGVSYNSYLNFTGLFPTGITMSSGCYPVVSFGLEHSYAGDLHITLISPSGQQVILFNGNNNPYSSTTHFGNCSDGATDGVAGCPATYSVVAAGGVSWSSGASVMNSAPMGGNGTCTGNPTYSGTCEVESGGYYIPNTTFNSANSFSALNGATLNGIWTLRVMDDQGSDDGLLAGWSLTFPASCYGNLATYTPQLDSGVWTAVGAAPVPPVNSATSTVVNNPGPSCPGGDPCIGNRLTDSIVVGPFNTAGTYTYVYTVFDENNCQYTDTVRVNVNCPTNCTLTATATLANISCSGSGNGSITVTPANGTAPYQYSKDGYNYQTSATFSSLAAGTYTVTVRDNIGCTASATATINAPTPISVTTSTMPETCNATPTGSATVTATGGVSPYVYSWSNGGTTATISNVLGNTYSVTVRDNSNCSVTASAVVGSVPPITGLDNIRVCATSLPYSWNGQNLSTSGTYTATLVAAAGCDSIVTLAFLVDTTSLTNQTAAICYYTQPYYNWQGRTLTNSGIYRDTLTSSAGCDSVVILNLSIDSLNFTTPSQVDVLCFGAATGSITSSTSGGTGTTYSWTYNSSVYTPNSQTNPTNLLSGNYRQIAVDVNGCRDTANFVITQQAQLIFGTPVITNIDCNGGNNGQIVSYASGGVLPYTYSWSQNLALDSTIAANLTAGTYTQTVTDANSCTAVATLTVTQPTAVQLSLNATYDPCSHTPSGKITSIGSGGTTPYQYLLIQGATYLQANSTGVFTSLDPGNYSVQMTDNKGCSITKTATVQARIPDEFGVTTTDVSCFGTQYHDGTIYFSPLSPNTPYRYSIDGGLNFSTDSAFTDLAKGIYTVVARNSFGCDTTFTVEIDQAQQVFASITPNDSTIQLGNEIVLNSSISQSYSIASYHWSPSEGLSCDDCPNPTFSGYEKYNNYGLTITYNDICTTSATAEITVEGEGLVYIPNAFSPNGDGNNDEFQVYGKMIKYAKLKVFNRWGEKVYDSMDNLFGIWDGTFKGALQPPSVYTYEAEIEFLNGKTKRQMGSLTLIR